VMSTSTIVFLVCFVFKDMHYFLTLY